MNNIILNKVLENHYIWIDSKKKAGKKADFSGIDLSEIDFSGTNLSEANFFEANLYKVNFSKACLIGADFSKTNLLWVNFSRADLRGADLEGADFCKTDLSKKVFEKTIGIFFIQIKGSKDPLIFIKYGKNLEKKQLQINEEIHSLNFWLKNYKETCLKHGYLKKEIKEYGEYIKFFNSE
jgi:uncharacterized protein YjbI with pentapeptide repeats